MVVSNLNYSAIVGCKAVRFNCTVQHLKGKPTHLISEDDSVRHLQGITVHMKQIEKCTTIVNNLIRSIAIDYKVAEFNVAAL